MSIDEIRKLQKEKWKLINEYQEITKKIYEQKYREKINQINKKINKLQRSIK